MDGGVEVEKDLISVSDLEKEEIESLFSLGKGLKRKTKRGQSGHPLEGKTLAMVFEKPSLRTRVTFEAGMSQLGGRTIYLAPGDIQLGRRESVGDVARNLSRWVDAIVSRTFSHQTVVELAANAAIPVINGLSDLEHPCQALTDFFTLWERDEKLNMTIAYVGDGNNVCHSLLLGSGILGVNFAVSTPGGCEPKEEVLAEARRLARTSGGRVELLDRPEAAVREADAVYTDVWTSMGQEAEAEVRRDKFKGFQVNRELLSHAKADAVVMHCLPAHRGEEITEEVLDSPNSIVLDQAENRLHLQKAILVTLMGQ